MSADHTGEEPADNPSASSDKREAINASTPGATATYPHHLPREAWIQIAKRIFVMSGFHNLSLLAAGTAFFAFLAITPLLAATVMSYGLIGDVSTVQAQMQQIVEFVPPEVAGVIEEQLIAVVNTNAGVAGLTLALSLSLAVYGGMRAAKGLIGALNIINSEHETRGIIKVTMRAGGLTLAVIMIALTGLISGGVMAWLQSQTGQFMGPVSEGFYKLLTWSLAMALGSVGFGLIMKYGPDRRAAKWRWLSPGSLLATFAWVGVSFGLSLYVRYVSNYNATYGSLSAIVVFLMWLFLTSYSILLGALLNAEIERQTHADTTIGPERPLGDRGAVLADSAVSVAPTADSLAKKRRRQVEGAAHKLARGHSKDDALAGTADPIN